MNQVSRKQAAKDLPRSVYVHVPFCRHRCGYCNFTLVAGRDDLIDRYLNAIEKEIGAVDDAQVDTVFIGGGTPTHLNTRQLSRLLNAIGQKFSFSPEIEFSVEANPHDITDTKVSVLADHGVNRISLGAQSFDSDKLKGLERDHDQVRIREAVESVRKRIANFSLDLIFGAPGETLSIWESDLNSALRLNPTHLSTYSLTIEKGTRFWNRQLHNDLETLPEDDSARFYEFAIDYLAGNQFEHYEVSNFANPGYRCQHNENCWMGKSYWAMGPGASRYLNGYRQTNHRSTTQYLKRLESGKDPTCESEKVDAEEAAREKLIFGLRRIQGIDCNRFRTECGFDVDQLAGSEIRSLLDQGFLSKEGTRLRLTRKGLLVSDGIWPFLL